ncbi:PKD domain-containing protein [Tamlana crocina]|uniref:PKD domain-containing protein n=1 Tax=Tamlana crocina TaxID=393006 RepID=A0ABX1DFK0_9FLAO|nr:PKD domain-containing protein [Tamlana crocina]NJX15418.1 PKD domain-containing protein [Tamlana crocina]
MKKHPFLSAFLFFTVIITTSIYAYSIINIDNLEKTHRSNSAPFAPPVVDFTFNNTGACSGTQVNFSPTVSGDGPFKYLWTFADDGSTSASENPSHRFNALGCGTRDINVSLTVTDANNESTTVTKTVPVQEKPNLSFYDIDAEANFTPPFDNCGNNTSNPAYTINVGNRSTGNCITSYDIDWGDGNTETNVTFPLSHTYAQLGSYNMSITGNGSNCDNTVTYLIKNSSNPTGAIISPGNTVNLCTPIAPLEFAIGSWGSNPPDTNYFVDYGDGTTVNYSQQQLEASPYYNSSDPANSQNFPIPHVYTESNCPNYSYTVVLYITTSCGETNLTAGPIIILKKPDVAFENPPTGCVNRAVQFNNTSTAGYNQNCDTNAGYYWDFGDGNTSNLRDPSHTYTAPGTYTISLYSQNFCGTTNTITNTICIEPEINPSFNVNTTNGCSPLAVTTTNTVDLTNSCGNETYLWNVSYTSDLCGTAPAQWSFTNGTDENSTEPSFNFETSGTYTITQTVTNSCGSNSTSQTIEVKQPPTVTLASIDDACGSVSINPTATVNSCAPSTETPTYIWSFPGGTPATSNTLNPGIISYATPGNYQVSLEVTTSCGSTTSTENFVVNPVPTITNTDLNQTICSGTDTTEINLTADLSGTTFSWTASAPTGVTGFITSGNSNTIPVQTITNSNTNSEDVTYTATPSLNGCDGAPVIFTLTVNPAPEFTSQPQSESVCENGTITLLSVSVSGSGSPTYQWYKSTSNSNTGGTLITGETNPTYTPPNTPTGTNYYYAVVSFSSGAGCDEITSNVAQIEVVEGIQIDTHPTPTQRLCVGGNLPNPLTVSHSGGTGTISYQWFSNTTNSNTGGTAITGATNIDYTPPTFTTSGTYFYYLEISLNGSGCSGITSDVAEITVVDDPVITTQPLATQTLCQGITPQTLEAVVSGGLGSSYNYQWYSNTNNNNTGGSVISGEMNSSFIPPTDTVGSYYYYVEITQPVAGCGIVSDVAEVNVNAAPNITSQPVSEVYCFGETINPLSFSYANGVGTPAIQWYKNTVDDNTTGTAISGENATSFTPPSATIGTVYYYAVVTFSSGGCTEITSNTAEITINQTPNISPKSATICSGNAFNISPDNTNGDITPAGTTYTWTAPVISPAGTITGASAESNPQSSISQTLTNTTTSPSTITYTVTPTSGNCVGNTFDVTITVNPSISITSTQTNSDCYLANSGALEIEITGGVQFSAGNPYQITWSGSNGFSSTDEDILNLAPGNYTVDILDDGGCPFTETFTITEPDELIFSNIDFDPETISCFGANDGSIGIDISGGTPPYTYNWTRNGSAFSNLEDLTNLAPGTYEITVSDANNCTPITQSFSIIEPSELSVSLVNQVDIICFGEATGEINISVTGGRTIETSPGNFDYSYSWTGPNGFTSNLQNLTALFAGTYNVTVTDRSGCIDTLEVILTQTDEIIIDYSTTEIECYGDNNASITINNISGGNPPYQVAWSNLGSGMSQTNLSAGTYTITVTDDTNCEKKAVIIIDEAPIFRISPMVENVSCFGENDGRIILNLEGGIDPVNLVWDDDSTAGVERNNIGPGTYTVTITDGTPCEITETFTITEPAALNLSANTTDALDCDEANSGSINLIVTGGSLPFTYSWSNGATSEDLNNIPPGNYAVTVTDANNCQISGDWDINRFEPITLNVDTETDFNCDTREVNQSFIAQVSGGVPPYSIQWSSGTVSGTNGERMSTSTNGLVSIDVTDSLGCMANFSYNVDIPELGDADFNITSSAYSSFGFYSIEDPIMFSNQADGDYISVAWDFGDGGFSSEENPSHTYINEGSYEVMQTVTYPFGCVYTKQSTLVIEKGYSLIMPNAFTPNNDNMNAFFAPESIALSNMEFNIYDTWGSLIYSEKGDSIKGWDGKVNDNEAENGNYYFTFSGQTFYGKTITQKGAFVSIK